MALEEFAYTLGRTGHQVTVRGAHSDAGGRVPVLLLHGGGPGCSTWIDFAAVLPAIMAVRDVVLLDLVQCGRSGFAPIEGPMWSYHAGVVGEALDQLGLPTVDVVAQSMGSAVTLRLAADAPDRVRRAVLTGAAPFRADRVTELGGDPGFGGEIWRASYRDGPPTPERLAAILERCEWTTSEAIPRDLLEARCALAAQPHQQAMARDRTLRGVPEDLEPLLGAVDAEVTLIWGREDPFVTPGIRTALTEAVGTSRAALIDGASHHAQSEQPRAWLDAALPALRR